jgi:Zn-finger nucleic acid-binding protein
MSLRTVKCPMCQSPMDLRDKHGVEIDLCPRCRGIWLDRGELDRIIERSGRFLEIPGEDGENQPGRRREDCFPGQFEWF